MTTKVRITSWSLAEESGLVRVDDRVPALTISWTKYFIAAQGYNIEHNIIHQDNEPTLRLLINGKKCATRFQNTLCLFLAKGYHDNKEIEFAKCHTQKCRLRC